MSIDSFLDPNMVHLLGLPGLHLTEYEARVLLALLIIGEKTPLEIAKTAHVPRSRTYNVLDGLVEKSLVEKTSSEPLTYRIAPDSIERIINLVREASLRFENKIEKMATIGSTGVSASIFAELGRLCRSLGYNILEEHKKIGSDIEIDMKAVSPHGLRVCFEIKSRPELISTSYVRKLGGVLGCECDALVIIYSGNISDDIKNLIERYGILSSSFEDAFGEKLHLLLRKFEQTRLEQIDKMNDLKKELESCNQRLMLKDRTFQEALSEHSKLRKNVQETRDLEELLCSTEKLMRRSVFLVHNLQANLEDLERMFISSRRVDGELLAHADCLQKDALASIGMLSAHLGEFCNKLAELKARRGIWFEYMLSENPFTITPPEKPFSMFNQEHLKESFEKILCMVDQTRSSVVIMVTGDYGSGKTHFMQHYVLKINQRAHGDCVAVYTLAKKDMFTTIKEFLVQSRIDLATSWLSTEEEWPVLEIPNNFYDAIENMAKLAAFLSKQGVNQIYWFIDELERAVAESHGTPSGAEEYPLLDQLKALIDRLQDFHVSLILSCTTQEWRKIEKQFPSIVSRLQHVFEIKPLKSTREVKDFISHLTERVRIGPGEKEFPRFSEEALDVILRESNGNPRKIIAMSREGCWKAIKENLNEVNKASLSSHIGT